MKCITICQPHAWMIFATPEEIAATGTGLTQPKRIENRDWDTNHRGPLLIHAGKSRTWFSEFYDGAKWPPMTFGAIVGVCDLIDIVWSEAHHNAPSWIWQHEHRAMSSRYWWLLGNVRKFKQPVIFRGAQGLFNVPDAAVASQLKLTGATQ